VKKEKKRRVILETAVKDKQFTPKKDNKGIHDHEKKKRDTSPRGERWIKKKGFARKDVKVMTKTIPRQKPGFAEEHAPIMDHWTTQGRGTSLC